MGTRNRSAWGIVPLLLVTLACAGLLVLLAVSRSPAPAVSKPRAEMAAVPPEESIPEGTVGDAESDQEMDTEQLARTVPERSSIRAPSERIVTLMPAETQGSLLVRFLGAPKDWGGDRVFPRFFVSLRGGSRRLRFRVGEQYEAGAMVLEGIPFGRYELRLEGLPGSCPGLRLPLPVVVGERKASIDLDLRAAGGLRLNMLRRSGERHVGYARVALILEEGRADPPSTISGPAVLRDFRDPPYLVYPLAPGRYHVLLQLPFHSSAHVGPGAVAVEPGEIREVLIEERQ